MLTYTIHEVNMARMGFLEAQRKQITNRLQELRPLYEEYLTLEKAQEALDSLGSTVTRRGPGRPPGRRSGSSKKTTRRGPGRPRGTRSARTTAARRGRPAARGRKTAKRGRTGGTRADHALAAVRAKPGITIPEIATKLGIRQNYLYRVMQGLQKERKVRRRGRGFHPA